MSVNSGRFMQLFGSMGSEVVFHREDGGTSCPCRTPEGFRDPAWHRENPGAPLCNEQGFLVVPVEFTVRGTVQPIRMRYNRPGQRVSDLLGDVQADDRIGIFPCEWNGKTLDFDNWSDAGEDFILYDNKRYLIVSSDKVPDVDGSPAGHWELGLRLIKRARPTDV